MEEDKLKQLIWKLTLINAVKFDGTPNKKAIMGKIMKERKDLRSQASTIAPLLEEVTEAIIQLNIDEQREKLLELDPDALKKKESQKEKKILPELPNINKYEKIVMRLAPYPSGALHIGNARMVILNDEYIRRYQGELILFFDDTIGSSKSQRDSPRAKYVLPESYDLIEDGLRWLGVNYSKIYYKSDRLEIFYEYCEKLINDGIAYVCFCEAKEFKDKYKLTQKDCPHRNNKIDTNLIEWNNMLQGKYSETTAVVRLKTGMDQKDPALRDQIIMRISEAEHPRVGNDYLVWPMLEFSWAIDDHLIGVTHILRGSDLIKEDFIENFIWEHFNWPQAEFLHYGRLNFSGLSKTGENLLSKTNARNNIDNDTYSGWDDPRTWSLQSLKVRGIEPQALKDSLLDLGLSINAINFSVNWLYSKNKNIIDELSDRYFYVEDPIQLEINGVPKEQYIAEPLLLPSKPEKGKRIIEVNVENRILNIYISNSDKDKMEINQVIRLKDLMNITIEKINKIENKIIATYHSSELNREYSIIQWVPIDENIKITILKPDGSISKGVGEINLKDIKLDKTIQFERFGFVNPVRKDNNGLFCYYTH
ncbi:MAG: glutamate--tRNA ligase [Promethearchaeota archaeon]